MRLRRGTDSIKIRSEAPSGRTGIRLIIFLLIQRLLHGR